MHDIFCPDASRTLQHRLIFHRDQYPTDPRLSVFILAPKEPAAFNAPIEMFLKIVPMDAHAIGQRAQPERRRVGEPPGVLSSHDIDQQRERRRPEPIRNAKFEHQINEVAVKILVPLIARIVRHR